MHPIEPVHFQAKISLSKIKSAVIVKVILVQNMRIEQVVGEIYFAFSFYFFSYPPFEFVAITNQNS